jgi:hypothetical protein
LELLMLYFIKGFFPVQENQLELGFGSLCSLKDPSNTGQRDNCTSEFSETVLGAL